MKFLTKFAPAGRRQGAHGRASLPLLVAMVLALALVLRVGLPVWSALAPVPASDADPAAADLAEHSGAPDLAALQSLNLFASPGAAIPAASTPAVTTALDLRLVGVVLAGNGDDSTAIIASGNRQGTYRRGETLPVGTNVLVDAIARDHVVIDNRGQRETLWLFEASAPAARATTAAGTVAAAYVLPPGTDQRVLKTAARLAEIIHVEPEQQNGSLVGYRLTPGARLKDFVQLGFETNDVVTAANGIALNDVSNLPQLYSLMDGATEVSFSLLRNGQPLTLKVTLSPETPANQ